MTVYRAPMYICYRFFSSLSNLVGWPVGGYQAQFTDENTDLERMSGVPPITVTGGRAGMCNMEVNSCPLLILLTGLSTPDLREVVMWLMMEGGGQSETPLT